jgi:hypothetical protein
LPAEAQAVNLSLQARPLRLGVFVADIPKVPWQDVYASALGSQTRIWGGAANIIFPLSDRPEDDELLWALVDLWDADSWELFVSSAHDLADLLPAEYDAWRKQIDHELAKEPPENRGSRLEDALAGFAVDQSLPDELSALLVRRGAAIHHDGLPMSHGALSGSRVPYPLTDVLDLRPLPDEVLDPQVDDGPTARLLMAAELGVLGTPQREALRSLGVSVKTVKPTSREELIRWLFRGTRPDGVAPFALGESGLSWFRSRPLTRDELTIVAGEDPRDFMLAYAIRRGRTHAWWFPESFFVAAHERRTALWDISSLALRRALPIVVTSATDPDAANKIAADLPAIAHDSVVIQTKSWQEALPGRANRLRSHHPVGFPERVLLEDGATPFLDTPIPRVDPATPGDLRWMVDIAVTNWTAIRHPDLAKHLVPTGGGEDTRTTRTGVSYSSPGPFVPANVPLEYLISHPQFRPLDVLDQLDAICRDANWTCQLSEKGQFAEAAVQRFGGFEELCTKLRDPHVAAILAAYLDGSDNAPGFRLSHKRRYLTLEELDYVCQRVGGPIVEDLQSRGVLDRGLVLKCQHCRYADWYPPRATDRFFSCTRCDTEQRPEKKHWMRGHEPAWQYRLHETVFQMILHRGDLPSLTVFERFWQASQAVAAVAELEFRSPDGKMQEIDFAVVDAGDLWLGEAFTDARYCKTGANKENERFGRLASLAQLLNARGVILATGAEKLDDGTRKRAAKGFPGPWPRLELREGAFMLSHPKTLIDKTS